MLEIVRKLDKLNQAGRIMTSLRDLDSLLDRILELVDEVFELSTCAVLLLDKSTGDLSIRRARGYDPEVVRTFRAKPGVGITGSVLENGEPVLVADVRSDPRYIQGVREAVSEMAAPLRIDSEILGVLDAESTQPNAFNEEDLELFAAFAGHVAVCINNATMQAQLEQRGRALRRKAERQAILAKAAALIQSELDLDRVLAEILALSHKALKFETCAVLLMEDNGALTVKASHGYPDEVAGMKIPVGKGITSEVVAEHRPVLVRDVKADERYIEGVTGGRCEMAVPMIVGDEFMGVLDAESRTVGAYDEEDLELFSIFGSHAAMAVRNASQMSELEKRRRQLEGKLRDLRLLGEAGEQICSLLNLDALLEETLRLAQRALSFDRCAVLLLDPDLEQLVLRMSYGYRDEVQGIRIPVDQGITGRVARSGLPAAVRDVTEDPDYIPGVKGGRSEMAVPLKVRGRIIGVLDAESLEPDSFGQRELELFGTFASWVAVAMHNSELFAGLERANAKLKDNISEIERMNQELTSYSSQITQANTELEARVRELMTLYEASKTITSSLDLDETLSTIVKMTREIVHASSSAIRFLDEETQTMLSGAGDAGAKGEEETPYVLEEPLRIGGRTIGIFELEADRNFSDEDRRMLSTLASQAAIAIENARLFERTQRTYYQTIRSLAEALEARDPYTLGHSERVTQYALAIAEALGLPKAERRLIEHAGLLHDIGKIGISDIILHKQSALTAEDRQKIEEHPLFGDTILGPLKFLERVQGLVKHHHEKFDGTGYPDGLAGETIPLPARIIGVADAFDAMTSDRPYRPAMTRDEAVGELKKKKGSQFDPKVVGAFLEILNSRWLDVGRKDE